MRLLSFFKRRKKKNFYGIVLCDGVHFFLCSDILGSEKEARDRGKEIERECRSMYYIKTIKFSSYDSYLKKLETPTVS